MDSLIRNVCSNVEQDWLAGKVSGSLETLVRGGLLDQYLGIGEQPGPCLGQNS